jgi:hypothetical protein
MHNVPIHSLACNFRQTPLEYIICCIFVTVSTKGLFIREANLPHSSLLLIFHEQSCIGVPCTHTRKRYQAPQLKEVMCIP